MTPIYGKKLIDKRSDSSSEINWDNIQL